MTILPTGLTEDQFFAWADTVSLAEIILVGGAIVSVLWGATAFVRKGWPWLKKFAKNVMRVSEIVEAVGDLPETLDSINKKLDDIHHETHTNTGTSMKDSTKRIEEVLGQQTIQLGELLVWQETHTSEALERLERIKQLEDTLPRGHHLLELPAGPIL